MIETFGTILLGLALMLSYYLIGAILLFMVIAINIDAFKGDVIGTLLFLSFWPVMWIICIVMAICKKRKGE